MTTSVTPGRAQAETAQTAPDRREVIRALTFTVSVLAVAVFVLRVNQTVTLPMTSLLVPLLLYPLAQLAQRQYRYSPLDVVYLVVLVGGLGGVLVFSSPYPIGFGDVHVHLQSHSQTVVDGHLSITPDYVATSFVGLYIITTALSTLGNVAPVTVARGLPLLTFPLLTMAFYHVFVSRFVTRREALLATLFFVLNYGVFRFNAEYRTLNLSFLLVVLLLALFIRGVRAHRLSREALALYAALTVGLVVSHFTTTIIYLVLLVVLTGVFAVHRRTLNPGAYLLITGAVLFIYLAYVAQSLTGFLRTVQREFVAAFAVSNVTSGDVGSGVVGVTYGRNMFLIEWAIRVLFVISFGGFALLWLRNRNEFSTFVAVSAVVMGLLMITAAVTGFLVNTGRILTFFAIPYAVAFAIGLLGADRVAAPTGEGWRDRIRAVARSPTTRNVTRVVVSVLLVLVLVNTVMKFPVDTIGSPEPIRTPGEVDAQPQMHIDDDDLAARTFVQAHFGQEDEREYRYGQGPYNRLLGLFFEYHETQSPVSVNVRDEYACDCGFAVVGETDPRHGKPAHIASPTASRVYDNGAVEVFELDNWAADSARWRQQLLAEEAA